MRKIVALVAAGTVVLSACTKGKHSPVPPGPNRTVLNVQIEEGVTLDPQKESDPVPLELLRCCLLRTLMSYKGVGAARDGARVFPDLAAGPPEASTDGLTWTFRIRPGIRYSPPLEDVTVTAGDFIRALNREACSECSSDGFSQYYTVIQGFAAFRDHKVPTISGLRAVGPLTLQIRLTKRTGDLPYRMAMPATAPIPPLPGRPAAPYGIATGHDKEDGRYSLIGTGPYMIGGTDRLDFDAPPGKQKPVAGFDPGKALILVMNPSWDPSTDRLRQQNVNGIDFSIGYLEDDAAHEVDSGVLDLCMDCLPVRAQVNYYRWNPSLRGRVKVRPADILRYISINVAQPPFDDVHVRKALSYAIDKQEMRRLWRRYLPGSVAIHIFPDSLEGGQRVHTPYRAGGDRRLAKEEMAKSMYDHDHDGVCDDLACADVVVAIDERTLYFSQEAELLARELEPIGITPRFAYGDRPIPGPTYVQGVCSDPRSHVALCLDLGWRKEYADGYTFASPLLSAASIATGCCDYGLLGASPQLLRKARYSVSRVPSADPQIQSCEALLGSARPKCWANLDRFLMEKVVPIVPLQFDNTITVLSARVGCYSFDEFAAEVALDHLCLVS